MVLSCLFASGVGTGGGMPALVCGAALLIEPLFAGGVCQGQICSFGSFASGNLMKPTDRL